MRTGRYLILVTLLAVNTACSADSNKVTFYVQLVRGNNNGQSPTSEGKPIGPKLAKKLRSVFKWGHYWEIKRETVLLARGDSAKVRLSQEREVEIDLTQSRKRTVTAYYKGEPVSRTTRPVGEAMTVVGGDRADNSAWFIIVRRDKPPE